MDDGPVDDGVDHQLPDPQLALRGRPDPAPGAPHLGARVFLDRRRLPGRDHAPAPVRLRARRAGAPAGLRHLRDRLVGHQHGARARPQLADPGRAARPLGPGRGLGQPGGHEGDRGMVPGARARVRGRALQHRSLVRLDARAAAGGLGHPQLRLADGVRDHGGDRARLGRVLAPLLRLARPPPRPQPRGAPAHHGGPGAAPRRRRPPLARPDPAPAELLGHRPAALPGRSHLGHADVLGPALPEPGPALRPQADRDVRLDAVPGRGCRLLRGRHDQPLPAARAASRSSTRAAGPSRPAR